MIIEKSEAAYAELSWVGDALGRTFRKPWVKYNPSIRSLNNDLLDGKSSTWDIVVRRVEGFKDHAQTGTIVFQFASPRAPHDLLVPGLEFTLHEGLGPLWSGVIKDVFIAPRLASEWH